jgi:hypothetical protein
VPALPSCLLDPLREQFLALLPPHIDEHPPGCHRPRIDDAVVFDKLVEALIFHAGYEQIADADCSATTMRRAGTSGSGWVSSIGCDWPAWTPTRRWSGWTWPTWPVDGCTTEAPCGEE